ncbi:6-pyruvoyl tetrahydropterin synthase [Caulifigura coniformis]|uniref:6-carboxy-5,6,7,8-tetrahydropterin synthase n=1 Tax=Caulifigura coniformis TaxID=2527983 RepID=A0A517SHE4_9PLAN|nr:6-pyruvoyl tetrahydropterin synthase family protein [Caulifigura coniformis]QDT55535.1 6-pyruvoyl tetrahydropterin synthase [Caulifigura coniformis]
MTNPAPSPLASFRVRVTKDHLVFSAAHFITIGDWCERLHGHNWRVAAEVAGPLDGNHFVVDFIALRDQLQKLVDELDHSLLVPMKHPDIQVNVAGEEVEIRFQKRRWVIPTDECRLLPIAQTTAELLAQYLAQTLCERMGAALKGQTSLRLDVEENFGQWAICELPLAGPVPDRLE